MSTERAPWPGMMAKPADLLTWLNRQRPADNEGKKAVFTLRWLVHAELERSVPEPPPTAITHFTLEEPSQTL